MSKTRERVLYADRRSPLLIEPVSVDRDIAGHVHGQTETIAAKLLEHGALLFRGFSVQNVADFDGFVGAIGSERLDYVYGSTPRTSLGDRIFTATEYPPAQEIPLHNENAYQLEWPLQLALCCLTAATSGGETPIADMHSVTAAIGTALLERLEARRVRYVRHYHPLVDVPWQKVFKTDDRAVVESYCDLHQITYDWLDGDILCTTQVSQGTAIHPVTRERVFFNQAHLFHSSSVGDAGAKALLKVFGANRLPRQTYYGDGGEFTADELTAMRTAFQRASLTFPWMAGDILLLDNMQFAHGRRPFKGSRKVVVALLARYREADSISTDARRG